MTAAPPMGSRLPLRGGVLRAIVGTAIVSTAMTVVSAGTGVIIARDLGPADRGDYAAVNAWFWLTLIIGELGLTAAITYFVARHSDRARDYLATARTMMLISGGIVAAIGFGLAPILAHGDTDLVFSYRLMFLFCVPAFLGAGWAFSLQATSIKRWNVMRLSQPIPYLVIMLALHVTDDLTLRTAVAGLGATVVAQVVVAYSLCRSSGLTGGRADRELAPPLARYGVSQMLAAAPLTVNTRFDQIVLSQTVRSAALGQYAVAVTMTSLVVPLVSAIGYVAFPRLAALRTHGARERRFTRNALVGAFALAASVSAFVALAAAWVVPWLFGTGFEPAVELVWLLAPGGVALAVNQVAGDILRGRGQPLAVAWAQGIGAVATIALLAALLPLLDVRGAAIASTVAYTVTLAIMLIVIRRPAPARQ